MIALYWVSFMLGGAFVAMSLMAGHGADGAGDGADAGGDGPDGDTHGLGDAHADGTSADHADGGTAEHGDSSSVGGHGQATAAHPGDLGHGGHHGAGTHGDTSHLASRPATGSALALGSDGASNGDGNSALEAQADPHAARLDVPARPRRRFSPFGLRFAIYALTGFGATGISLGMLGSTEPMTAFLAAGVGLSAGAVVQVAFRGMSADQPSSAAGLADWVGREGEVVLPLTPGMRGKIRLTVKGSLLDVTARAPVEVPIGARVLVVAFRDGEATVEPLDAEATSLGWERRAVGFGGNAGESGSTPSESRQEPTRERS